MPFLLLQINAAGRMSNDSRNEGQLVCDIIGLEPLVDEITNRGMSSSSTPTEPTALGPFYRPNAPIKEMGSTIVHGIPDGDHTFMYGRVLDFKTGNPIEAAELDIWHTAPNGLYEQQDPNQVDFNLRGRFFTGKDGSYSLYCLRPTAYPIPDDGPAGELLKLLDRHPMRPAHIHFILRAPGYKSIITQVFDSQDKYVADDAAFGTKQGLLVDFVPRTGDPRAQFELHYDFHMATLEDAEKSALSGKRSTSKL